METNRKAELPIINEQEQQQGKAAILTAMMQTHL